MKKIKIFFIPFILFVCACQQKPLQFTKLQQFCKIDTLYENDKPYFFKNDYYLVDNYRENLETEKTIDSFAYKNRASDLKKYESYKITIYKSSDITNIENLKQDPWDFDDYSLNNDMIFSYVWGGGTWSGKFKWENRKIVEAQPMIRED